MNSTILSCNFKIFCSLKVSEIRYQLEVQSQLEHEGKNVFMGSN